MRARRAPRRRSPPARSRGRLRAARRRSTAPGPTAEWPRVRRRQGRPALVAAHADHARERRRARGRLELPPRRRLRRQRRRRRAPPSTRRRSWSDGALYFCTGKNRVIALDAETGRERWAFDPKQRCAKLEGPYPRVCRGVAYWEAADAGERAGALRRAHLHRHARLRADRARRRDRPAVRGLRRGRARRAARGHRRRAALGVLPDLAAARGRRRGRGRRARRRQPARRRAAPAWCARSTRAPARCAGPGIPCRRAARRERPGAGATARGTPNVWSILSADPERGLVFVPTGNAVARLLRRRARRPRLLRELGRRAARVDGRSVRLALPDRAPRRLGLRRARAADAPRARASRGRARAPRVAQITKMGHLFLLDRATGEPLFPVEERPVPQGGVPGETLSPTQPFPTHPPPLHPREARARGRVGLHALGPRRSAPRRSAALPLRGHLHAAVARGLDPVPEQRGRAELGRRLDRPACAGGST